jgi:hypothetical protein
VRDLTAGRGDGVGLAGVKNAKGEADIGGAAATREIVQDAGCDRRVLMLTENDLLTGEHQGGAICFRSMGGAMARGIAKWWRWSTTAAVVVTAAASPLLSGTATAAASLCGPPEDTVPPQVAGLTFSTGSVDLSGPRKVTVTAVATDTASSGFGSGVKRIGVVVFGRFGGADVRSLSPVSGTPDDGVWQGSFVIAKNAVPGTWLLREVDATDAAGNSQIYNHFSARAQSPSDPTLQAGWDTSLTVTGPATPTSSHPPPTEAGRLTGFDVSPQFVDTTSRPERVRVTARFAAPHPRSVRVFVATASGRRIFGSVSLVRGAGDQWSGDLTVRQWVGDAVARPQVFASYRSGVKPATRDLTAIQLRARHFASALTITSGVDHVTPALRTLSLSLPAVDTTTGTEVETVSATATDALSGVHGISASFSVDGQSTSEPGSSRNVVLTRSGNEWTGQVGFARCVPSGNWRIDVLVTDRAGNAADYPSSKLIAAGLPGSLTVTSDPGDVIAPSVLNATASAAAHTVTLDFSEGVKNVSPSTLSVFAVQPAVTRYQHPLQIAAISCSNGTPGAIACDGSGGTVTSATLSVPSLAAGQSYRLWANLDAVISQLTDAAGNPLTWNLSVAEVRGS